jgi:hypothetical protein
MVDPKFEEDIKLQKRIKRLESEIAALSKHLTGKCRKHWSRYIDVPEINNQEDADKVIEQMQKMKIWEFKDEEK